MMISPHIAACPANYKFIQKYPSAAAHHHRDV